MNLYIEQKEKKSFIKRRAKLIRSHWRNGIAGLESIDPTQAALDDVDDSEARDKQVLSSGDPKKLSTYFHRLESRKDRK